MVRRKIPAGFSASLRLFLCRSFQVLILSCLLVSVFSPAPRLSLAFFVLHPFLSQVHTHAHGK